MRVETIENCGDFGKVAQGSETKVIFLTNSIKDKFRTWAIRNAFSIALLAIAFVVTWLLLMVLILTNTKG